MIPKGLLIVADHNQEYLLVPEVGSRSTSYSLSVLQHQKGQWVRLQPQSARLLRESMLGALLEFFANLCRILNQTQPPMAGAKNMALRKSSRTRIPNRRQESLRQTGQPPKKETTRFSEPSIINERPQ